MHEQLQMIASCLRMGSVLPAAVALERGLGVEAHLWDQQSSLLGKFLAAQHRRVMVQAWRHATQWTDPRGHDQKSCPEFWQAR